MFILGSLIGKRVVDFLLVIIELFPLDVMAEALRFRSNAVSLTQNFRYRGTSPPIIFAWIVRPTNALQLCR